MRKNGILLGCGGWIAVPVCALACNDGVGEARGEPLERNYFRRGGAGVGARIYIGGVEEVARPGCWGRGSVGIFGRKDNGCGKS